MEGIAGSADIEGKKDSFPLLCAFLLERINIDENAEFVSFFKKQLSIYIKNNGPFSSIAQADMVSDLIKETYVSFIKMYDSSPFYFPEGRKNLTLNIKIVFPK